MLSLTTVEGTPERFQETEVSEIDPYRLPRNVLPLRYDITLTPDLDAATFAGEEHVRIDVLEEVQEITVNAADLDLFEVELISDNGDQIPAAVRIDTDLERAIITPDSPVQPGQWTLHTTFAGTLNDKLRGFYRSTFTDEHGAQRVLATTEFEATDARRAFPCWDEPDMKAVFSITLIVDEDMFAVSNASVREETSLGNGKRQVEFNDTIKMSTYIVAFVVGPLVATEPIDVDGVALRVVCVPGQEHLGDFALESGAASLRFFSDYFGIDYPGDKIDLIAIPDFAAGAMENFGCITFRETALLVDTTRASRAQIERVAEVVGHEMAHMWFGDLVTMKWWNGLWLNEAFATFMENLFTDNFRKEWQRWVGFSLNKASAIGVDSLHTTRAIEYEVRSPHDAEEMFDVLTYSKGGSVLRMLEQHLGPEVFRKGVAHYLNKHSYGNAETTDLWDALDSVSDEPVRTLMDTWIFQAGHPLLAVSAENESTLQLSQSRSLFLDDGAGSDVLWSVPVALRASIGGTLHEQRFLLTGPSTKVDLPGAPDWVVLNAGGFGFYPVSYSSDLLAKLTANVDRLDALERFALVNDTWNACLAGHVELADVVAMLELMKSDQDPNVWRSLLPPLRALDHLATDAERPAVQALARSIAQPNYERLGWTRSATDSEQGIALRGLVVGAMSSHGADENVRAEASARFNTYLSDPSTLDPELVAPVQAAIATGNDPDQFELLRKRINDNSLSPQEKIISLVSLAQFTDPVLVDRILAMLLTDEVRPQDAPYAMIQMIARREIGDRTWSWVEANWNVLLSRFPDNSIDRMVGGTTGRFDPAAIARADAFLDAHPVPGAAKSVAQTRERLEVNRRFYERNAGKLGRILGAD